MEALGKDTSARPHSFRYLMFIGLLAGLASAVIAAPLMLALSTYQFYAAPHPGVQIGTPADSYFFDLPSALYAAAVWYVPGAVLVYAPLVRLLRMPDGGLAAMVTCLLTGAALWGLVAWGLYSVYGLFLHVDPGERGSDMLTAALSGALFGAVFAIILEHRSRRHRG